MSPPETAEILAEREERSHSVRPVQLLHGDRAARRSATSAEMNSLWASFCEAPYLFWGGFQEHQSCLIIFWMCLLFQGEYAFVSNRAGTPQNGQFPVGSLAPIPKRAPSEDSRIARVGFNHHLLEPPIYSILVTKGTFWGAQNVDPLRMSRPDEKTWWINRSEWDIPYQH